MTNDVRVYTGKLFYDGSYTDTFQWVKLDDVRSELERLRNKCAALTLVAYGTPEKPKDPLRAHEPTEKPMRECPDSADGNHVLKQDGPFSIVYCDACGMNRGWRTQEPESGWLPPL